MWLSEDISDWSKNVSEICRKAYGRVGMLTKLKYAGMDTQDLIEIYCLFIRSTSEYCSAVFGSSLTQKQSRKLTNIEKTCLRIILQESYISYSAACEMAGITPLAERRSAHLLSFAKRCLKHPINKRMFPLNPESEAMPDLRQREKFTVNFARGAAYHDSAIPTAQRMLNKAAASASQ
jgi:hypothetical protein